MTCSVRCLTVKGLDSSPCILFVSPDGSKTIVNCGEGCQRSFLEFQQKMTSVHRICLTHIGHDAVGGLPGMILTAADAVALAVDQAQAALQKKDSNGGGSKLDTSELPGLDIIGPRKTKRYVASLRHFMRRDRFSLRIHEGSTVLGDDSGGSKNGNGKKRKRQPASAIGRWSVESIAIDSSNKSLTHQNQEVLSFIFTSPAVPGRFNVERAQELKIPKGPLYAKLKSGESVTFTDPETGQERTVESKDVVDVGCPGAVVLVLCYPTLDVLQGLLGHRRVADSLANPNTDLIVHLTTSELYQEFGKLEAMGETIEHILITTNQRTENRGTHFFTGALGAYSRSLVNRNVYEDVQGCESYDELSKEEKHVKTSSSLTSRTVSGSPMLEYIVIPRKRKGFSSSTVPQWKYFKDQATKDTMASGAVDVGKFSASHADDVKEQDGEILFLGTGSALPCKDRNVTGIYCRMKNGNAIMFDIGEGSLGQLLQMRCRKSGFDGVVTSIKAVWISHAHADHHVGLVRLLSERSRGNLSKPIRPLLVVGPPSLLAFLTELEQVDSSILGSYEFASVFDFAAGVQRMQSWDEKKKDVHKGTTNFLLEELGITKLEAVQVSHCKDAFAVVASGTPFGRIAYSGDCRPSAAFSRVAHGANVLIHEATFEDGMEAEALMKKHCTVGQALQVARDMQAEYVVLTHFSQRYPRIPPISNGVLDSTDENSPRVVFAFDFMRLTPKTLLEASRLTRAMQCLYPAGDEEEDGDEVSKPNKYTEALGIPGIFAQPMLL